MLHGILRFPISRDDVLVVVTWWAVALGGLTYGLWDWSLPHAETNYELPELLGFDDTPQARITFYVIIGVFFALTLPFVVRACALVEAWLGRALLTGVADLRDQVADLTEDRATAQAQTAAAVSAEATALRRLERDIHDGPQQRLVRLAVDLGRAQQQLDTDPEAARADRGRGAQPDPGGAGRAAHALPRHRPADPDRPRAWPRRWPRWPPGPPSRSSWTSRTPERLPALAEQTAYFTIAEALTNVAKHSGATPVRRSRCSAPATG